MVQRQAADHQGVVTGGFQAHGAKDPVRRRVLQSADPNNSRARTARCAPTNGSLEKAPFGGIAEGIGEFRRAQLALRPGGETEMAPELHWGVRFKPAANRQYTGFTVIENQGDIRQLLAHLWNNSSPGAGASLLSKSLNEARQRKWAFCARGISTRAVAPSPDSVPSTSQALFCKFFRLENERDAVQVALAPGDADQGVTRKTRHRSARPARASRIHVKSS